MKNYSFDRKEMLLTVCNTVAPLHSQQIQGGEQVLQRSKERGEQGKWEE